MHPLEAESIAKGLQGGQVREARVDGGVGGERAGDDAGCRPLVANTGGGEQRRACSDLPAIGCKPCGGRAGTRPEPPEDSCRRAARRRRHPPAVTRCRRGAAAGACSR